MAERLDEFPSGATKYPWEDWLDGSIWLLRKGVDYDIGTPSMRQAVARAAKASGKQLRTRTEREKDGTEALIIQTY